MGTNHSMQRRGKDPRGRSGAGDSKRGKEGTDRGQIDGEEELARGPLQGLVLLLLLDRRVLLPPAETANDTFETKDMLETREVVDKSQKAAMRTKKSGEYQSKADDARRRDR